MIRQIYMAIESYFLKFKKKKDILFVVRNRLMLSYVRAIYKRIEQDDRLRLWICLYKPCDADDHEMKVLKVKNNPRCISYYLARYIKWDLIVFPDHKPVFRADCHKIFVDHSLGSGRTVDGDVYEYGRRAKDRTGNIIYKKIFVASHFIAEGIKNHYPDIFPYIRVVGNLFIDELMETQKKKTDLFKEKNLDHDRKTIMFASTWTSDSLIHNYGQELIAKLPELASKYNVIISAHYNNYYFKYPGCLDWRNILGKINMENVYVIEPGTEPYRYLALTDLLIMDITSLGLYFTIFGKPIIFWNNVNLDCATVNLIDELRKAACVVGDISNLDTIIDKAILSFDKEKMKALSSKVSSYQGESEKRYKEEIYQSLLLGH